MHVTFIKHLVISLLENLCFGNENVTCNASVSMLIIDILSNNRVR